MITPDTIVLALAILSSAAGVIWKASSIKTTVDTHGNAIGEHKRRLDAHEKIMTQYHGRISHLEGRWTDYPTPKK